MNPELLTFVINALVFMGGLGVILAGVLALANKKLHVHEDPRIGEV